MIPVTSIPPTNPTTGTSLHVPSVMSASIAASMLRNLARHLEHLTHMAGRSRSPQAPDVLPAIGRDYDFLWVYFSFEPFMYFLQECQCPGHIPVRTLFPLDIEFPSVPRRSLALYRSCRLTSPRLTIRSLPSSFVLSTTISFPLSEVITAGRFDGGK